MLYKKNSSAVLSDELFANPTAEYRSTPFWAWNNELDIDELKRQIEVFKEMGFGGFHMHVRTGLTTPYLSDGFMELIKGCTEKAKDEQMLSWLYDEDRWPSGFAGGLVTKDEEYRARYLLISAKPMPEVIYGESELDVPGKRTLIKCYDIVLNADGSLSSYKIIDENDNAAGSKCYVYLVIGEGSSWHNNKTYVDTLSEKAIKRFIEVTHERYKQCVGDEFDKTVPAIFTDEPQFTRKHNLRNPLDWDYAEIPWTDDFPDTFKQAYGFDIFDYLPELFWEKEDGEISKARYLYHDHICERFTHAFSDTIGEWCDKNGISLTGHMMEEPTLRSQTSAIGEAMRAYRSFGIPGIDMLTANFEFTTAKQTQSAVNQYGKEGMLSELYGVTGWDYDYRGYKLHGDWQACLGVSVRVPHLSWVSMEGEAKRDYPASISYQSPWWKEYSYLENHFARVNTLMTRGKPVVKVGVIHPIESYWLHFGPEEVTKEIRDKMDNNFLSLTELLLKGSIDFDFISESQIPSICSVEGNQLRAGKMKYDAVLVPGCESLRSTTVKALGVLRKAGGKIIFAGDAPTVCDGETSAAGKELYDLCDTIPYEKEAILSALEEYRTVKITEGGKLSDGFIYRLREDNDGCNLFISRACEPPEKSSTEAHNLSIEIKGTFYPVIFDTITGEKYSADYSHTNGKTIITHTLYDYDSLLVKLYGDKNDIPVKTNDNFTAAEEIAVPDCVDFTLDEENVYLIDMCEYSLDDSKVYPEEEILRLDNICRKMAGFEERGGHVAQPWTQPKDIPSHKITLIKRIESEINYLGAFLAIERPEDCEIEFNGIKVNTAPDGWFTDKSIKRIALPEIKAGENILKVTLPLGKTTNTEWMYILGNFGVKVTGHKAVITKAPEKLSFGSITAQGFPFYGGNITYHIPVDTAGKVRVFIPGYYGALISVSYNSAESGKIVFPPYTLDFEADKPGMLNLKLFGNRANCFGPVHRITPNGWIGPNAWHTEGDDWSYDYILKKIGITDKPVIMK